MHITHYYPINCPAFSRITQYSDEEQKEIVKILSSMNGSALTRFKNFDTYYQKRIQTEMWLYEASKILHISSNEKSPWYFVLGDNVLMDKGFGSYAQAYRLNLDLIDPSHITFTIGDSIAMYFSPNIKNELFDKKTILDFYINKNHKINEIYKYLQPQHQYIEAQLWSNKYF